MERKNNNRHEDKLPELKKAAVGKELYKHVDNL